MEVLVFIILIVLITSASRAEKSHGHFHGEMWHDHPDADKYHSHPYRDPTAIRFENKEN
ncbi:MAG: hypothetical protein ABR616_18810 [Dermatophilaceae bacterium]|nr:hypothetical protein [Intrasporangiaceae bacterium]